MILLLSAVLCCVCTTMVWVFYKPSVLRMRWAMLLSPWGSYAIAEYKIRVGALSEGFLLAYREAVAVRALGTDIAVLRLIDVGLEAARSCDSWLEKLRSVVLLSRTVAAVAPIQPFPKSRTYPWPLDWLAFLAWVAQHCIQCAVARWKLQLKVFRGALKSVPTAKLYPFK